MSEGGDAPPARARLGWGLIAALVLYTVGVFYGVGVPAERGEPWYDPRAFLFEWPGLDWLLESPARAVLGLGTPALLLCVACLATCPSALGRTLALSSLLASLLFVYYGTGPQLVWSFFGWRGSAVLCCLALTLGAALAAPALAASWLRLSWPLRAGVYLPVAFGVLAFVRNATGTDPSLRYSLSPWPVVPVFGLEVGALLILAVQVGVACGAAGLARASQRGGRWPGLLGLGAGLALPALLLLAADALGLLPFRLRWFVWLPVVGAAALATAGVAVIRARPGALRLRARWIALGAACLGLPLLSAQALARWDYQVTRERDAQELIGALERYYAREELYPDSLEELIETDDLQRIPTPSIGFSFLYDGSFRYQSFGTSFLLEFPAPRWVECAYSPPYEDEDEDESAELDAEDGGEGDSPWSCPSRPPELW